MNSYLFFINVYSSIRINIEMHICKINYFKVRYDHMNVNCMSCYKNLFLVFYITHYMRLIVDDDTQIQYILNKK